MEKKLGRGLDSLIPTAAETSGDLYGDTTAEVAMLDIKQVFSNPLQPREHFDETALAQLAGSLAENGFIQPIVVRLKGSRYEIIAGERRWRAAQKAGLETVPAIIREASDEKMLELALVENIQRRNLNAIERAKAYHSLLTRFKLTQEEAAVRLGIERSTLANFVRLLDLPEEVQGLIGGGKLSFGHARALLGAGRGERTIALARSIVAKDLSVRKTEELVRAESTPAGPSQKAKAKPKSANIRDLEAGLRELLGTRVEVRQSGRKGSGKVIIDFYSLDDFDRVLDKIGLKRDL